MKRAIVLLLVVSMLGFAYAEDAAAPAAPAVAAAPAPVITFGLSADLGHNMLKEKSRDDVSADASKAEAKAVMQTGGATYMVEPWINFAFGDFSLKYTQGVKSAGYNYQSGMSYLSKIVAAYKFGGVTLTDTMQFDINDYTDRLNGAGNTDTVRPWYNDLGLKVAMDNVSGELVLRQGYALPYDYNSTLFGAFMKFANTATIRNAWFQIDKIFDVWTVKAGDRLNPFSLRMATIADAGSGYTSQSSIGGEIYGEDTAPFVFNTVDLKPLTLYVGSYVPTAGIDLDYYFFGAREGAAITSGLDPNLYIGGKFDLENVGSFDLGVALGFDATTNQAVLAPTVAQKAGLSLGHALGIQNPSDGSPYLGLVTTWFDSLAAETQVWFDANITAVPNLAAQFGLDATLGSYADKKAYAAGTPAVTAVPYTNLNIGLEGSYDLKDAVAGLKVTFALYTAMALGGGYETLTGAAYVAPTAADKDATFYNADYTEANIVFDTLNGLSPLQFNLGVSYKMDDKLSFSFSNNLDTRVDDLQKTGTSVKATDNINWASIGGKNAKGFYGKDSLKLGCDITAGKGTIGFNVAYALYLGLPTAADLYTPAMTTDAQKASVNTKYASFISSNFNPWSVGASYKVSF